MKHIYLFRHGMVEDAYADRVRGGEIDCDLSDAGKQMSLENTRWLIQQGVQRVVTSGMRRADYMGALLCDEHNIPHVTDPRLQEMHMGSWDGRRFADVTAEFPSEVALFKQDPFSVFIPKAEQTNVFRERVLAAWEDLLLGPEEHVAVVAHGLVNTVILSAIGASRQLHQQVGCLNEIVIEPPPRLLQQNIVLYNPILLEGARH